MNRANLAQAIWFTEFLSAPETFILSDTLTALAKERKVLKFENVWPKVKAQLADLGYSEGEQLLIGNVVRKYEKQFRVMAISESTGFNQLVLFDRDTLKLEIPLP